jgi:hypothetical protein
MQILFLICEGHGNIGQNNKHIFRISSASINIQAPPYFILSSNTSNGALVNPNDVSQQQLQMYG